MVIKEREWKDSTFSYRFGFNGKEQDDEVSGSGNSYDYGFRIYNPRLGKFLSVDPLFQSYPWYTPYQYAGNSPIAFIDMDGLERVSSEETRKNPGSIKLGKEVNQVFKDAQNNYNKAKTETERLTIIEQTFREVIKAARNEGFNHSADFLETWLDENNPGCITLDAGWLLFDSKIGSQGRLRAEKMVFEGAPKDARKPSSREGIVKELIEADIPEGATIEISDNWDALATNGNEIVGGDEFYALGDFTINSDASFKATRDGDIITAVGTIAYSVNDDYGFDKGKKVMIKGYTVYDDWGARLEDAGMAKGFEVNGKITISYEIKIDTTTGNYETTKFDFVDDTSGN
jgi:RHS repeat-associated protein